MSSSPQSPQSDWSFPVFVPNSNAAPEAAAPDVRSEFAETAILQSVTPLTSASRAVDVSLQANSPAVATNCGVQQASRTQSIPRTPVTPLETTSIWGLPFAIATMEDAIELADRVVQAGKPEYFITANLNYLMLTEEHQELQQVNRDCFCFLADGNPIVWRSKLEPSPLPCRVAGSDMIIELARLAANKGYRIFFLGGAPGVAESAAKTLHYVFPNLQIAGTYSPPFRQLSPQEHEQMLAHIRQAKTDILLVAFGQPKGELWIKSNLNQLQVPLSIQLGASFDFLAGTAKRAPKLWQMIGCEWLYRALSDPKRLLPRYGKNIQFLAGLLLQDFTQACQRIWASIPRS